MAGDMGVDPLLRHNRPSKPMFSQCKVQHAPAFPTAFSLYDGVRTTQEQLLEPTPRSACPEPYIHAPSPVSLTGLGTVVQAARLRRTMTEAEDRKQKNRIAHSKPGSVIIKPARKKKIVAELE